MLAALRGVLKECLRLGVLSADEHAKVTDLQNIKSQTLPTGRALKLNEIASLIKVCAADLRPNGRRDVALIAIARAGLRRSEIVKLDLDNFDPETGSLTIRGGKGRKDRIAYLSENGIRAVADWIKVRGDAPGALLLPVDRFGRIATHRLSDQAVLIALKRRAKQAGIEKFTPHDFRRTFIGDLLDAGADIVTVQKLAGHANPATTSRYDRRGEETKRTAARLLDLPYDG